MGNFKTPGPCHGTHASHAHLFKWFENTNTEPNENYARELFELFTLGGGNGYIYATRHCETSKALTGYNLRPQAGGPIIFNTNTFFNGDKTIFDQTGN